MLLSKKQEQGLHIAVERYKNRMKYTCISGYAGSGKSTLGNCTLKLINPTSGEIIFDNENSLDISPYTPYSVTSAVLQVHTKVHT